MEQWKYHPRLRASCFKNNQQTLKDTSKNPKLCVTLPQQNAHLLHVNCAFASVASLDFWIIRSPLNAVCYPSKYIFYTQWLYANLFFGTYMNWYNSKTTRHHINKHLQYSCHVISYFLWNKKLLVCDFFVPLHTYLDHLFLYIYWLSGD